MNQPTPKNNVDNRRDFLRESLILAAVPAGLAGNTVQTACGAHSATQPVRLGVLGCGRRGMQLTRAALAASGARVQLCGLADIFADRVQQTFRAINSSFADQVLIEANNRLTGMRAAQQLADSDVQAVIVAAAPGFRLSHLRLLAAAGKHLYVERPLATSLEDTLQIAQLAERACQQGQSIQFGMQHRHQPFFVSLVEQLHQGAIGKILLARVVLERPIAQVPVRSKRVSEHDFRLRNWQQDAALGGHPLVEQLSGQLDLMNWIAGTTPESACPVADNQQFSEVKLAYPTGLSVSCQLRTAQSGPGTGLTIQVQGTTGWCDLLKGKIYNQANRVLWSATGSPADSQAAMDSWLASIQQCSADSATFVEASKQQIGTAVEATLTALLGQLALEQRQTVAWPAIDAAIHA